MIFALLALVALPAQQTLDFGELSPSLVVVQNPLAIASPISNAALGDALAEALREGSALEPRVVDATANDCADLSCFLDFARIDAPRAKVAWHVTNRRSRDGAVVSVTVRAIPRYLDALASGMRASDAEQVATTTVAIFSSVEAAAEVPFDAVIRRFADAGALPRGRQARARVRMPAAGTIAIAPHPARTIDAGEVTLMGLEAGPRRMSIAAEGYEPFELEAMLALDVELPLALERSKTTAWWARELTLWGGLALAGAGAAILVGDNLAVRGTATFCSPGSECTHPIGVAIPIAGALLTAGAVGTIGAWATEEGETPWWAWALMGAGAVGVGVVIDAAR